MRSYSKQILYILLFLPLIACDVLQPDLAAPQPVVASSLQAIHHIRDDLLVVSDTAFRQGEWSQGRLIFVDTVRQKRLATWYTPYANPQKIAQSATHLYVLSSGMMKLTQDVQVAHSAISRVSLAQLDSWLAGTHTEIPLVDHWRFIASELDFGYWTDLIVNQDAIFVSSGIHRDVLRIDISADQHIEDQRLQVNRMPPFTFHQESPDEPASLSLRNLAWWNDSLLVLDFNQDLLLRMDDDGIFFPCQPHLGAHLTEMEGAQNLKVLGDRLWFILALSGHLSALDLGEIDWQNPMCTVQFTPYTPALGQIPNDLWVDEKYAYVLHSGDYDLWVYQHDTQSRVHRIALSSNLHPWHFSKSKSSEDMYFTQWLAGGISKVNVRRSATYNDDNHVFLKASQLQKIKPKYCAFPNEDLTEKRSLDAQGLVLTWDEDTKLSVDQSSPSFLSTPQLALTFKIDQVNQKDRSPDEYPALKIQVSFDFDHWITLSAHQDEVSFLYTSTIEVSQRVHSNLSEHTQVLSDTDVWQQSTQSALWQVIDPSIGISPYTYATTQNTTSTIPPITSSTLVDPCLLFEPKYQAVLIDLQQAWTLWKSHPSYIEDKADQGLSSGYIPLRAIRIQALYDDQLAFQHPVEIEQVAYRHW